MKKVALTIAASLFITGLSMAMVGPSGDNDDNGTATHSVTIEIPTVALVDVESGSGEADVINLTPTISSLEAGEAVNFGSAKNSDLWLNYTSIVEKGNGNGNGNNPERQITVKLSNGSNLPDGVSLLLSAAGTSTGAGTTGSPVSGKVSLSSTAQDLVTGIGSCYTGSGENKGHQLTYELSVDEDDYNELEADTYSVEILYTITGD